MPTAISIPGSVNSMPSWAYCHVYSWNSIKQTLSGLLPFIFLEMCTSKAGLPGPTAISILGSVNIRPSWAYCHFYSWKFKQQD